MPHGRGASPRQLRHNDLPSAAGFGDFQHSLPHSAHGMDCLPFLDGKGSSPSSAMKLSSPTPYPWVAHTEPYALRGRRAAWGRVSAPGGVCWVCFRRSERCAAVGTVYIVAGREHFGSCS